MLLEESNKANVLRVKQVVDYEHNLDVQFINTDGSIYVFGHCYGATEKGMPPKNSFNFMVKNSNNDFRVTSIPLYQP